MPASDYCFIPGLFTTFEKENLAYKWDMDKYRREHGLVQEKESPEVSAVSLSSIRRNREEMGGQGYVTERRAGKYVERRVRKYQSGGTNIRRLPFERLFDGTLVKPYVRLKDIEVDEETGEEIVYADTVRLCKDNEGRMADPKQVRRTCDNFKWLIRANERRIRLFVTLTYAQNMTDTKRLYQDYRKFVQRLRRAYPDVSGYLVAFEPQKRGAWHAHILLLSDKPFLFIPNKRMRKLWGHGFTKTQRCKNVRDIGSYVTAYLTNLKEGKRTKKGQRLGMYPSGFHFLRSSKTGVERTKIERWYGKFDDISYPGEIELIYDYENVKRIDRERDLYQVTKIFCFREKDSPPGNRVG